MIQTWRLAARMLAKNFLKWVVEMEVEAEWWWIHSESERRKRRQQIQILLERNLTEIKDSNNIVV